MDYRQAQKSRLIRKAWGCRSIYPLAGNHPIIHFLYFLKYAICVLLGRYRKDQGGELVWMTDLYPIYTVMFDPPEPGWDEHYVGSGFRNWYYSDQLGIR